MKAHAQDSNTLSIMWAWLILNRFVLKSIIQIKTFFKKGSLQP